MTRLLILGGTAEARALAAGADALSPEIEVITSWAGRTGRQPDLPGRARIGGFGGAEGLGDYLRSEAVDLVVDATHPFARVISANARDACDAAGVARLQLVRPAWKLPAETNWIAVPDLETAAAKVQEIASRAFLTTGKQTVEAFSGVTGVWFLVRLIDPPPAPLPLAAYEVTTGRPPYALETERALMADHRIDAVVTKASGGTLPAKIVAANELGLPIIGVAPPPPQPGDRAADVEAALSWIADRL